MIDENSIYFEISEGGNLIRIELLEFNFPNAELDWDKNWIRSTVYVKGGAFSGAFAADLMTLDFVSFKDQLEKLYDKLNGQAIFQTLEEQVEIKITGDGIGHLNAKCIVMDRAGIGNELRFEIDFDQTQLPNILSQLKNITDRFPKGSDLN